MFGSGNYGVAISDSPNCKRDLEKEASYLKKRIDRETNFLNATKEFLTNDPDMQREHKILLYAMVGDLTMSLPQLNSNYDLLLAQIEKEANDQKK